MDQVLKEALGLGLALEQSSWLTRYGQHGTGAVGIVFPCGKGMKMKEIVEMELVGSLPS